MQEWMDEENITQTHTQIQTWILFSFKNERDPVIFTNMDETVKYYTEQNKLGIETDMLYNSTCIEIL
jgi:hypothetical protein